MLRPPASSIPQNRPTGAGGSAFTGRRLLAVLDDALSAVHLPAGARPWASVHRRSLPRCRDVRPRSGVLLRAQGSLVGEDKLTLGAYLLSTASQMARNARSANYSRQNSSATGPPCQRHPISLLLLFARCEVCMYFGPANACLYISKIELLGALGVTDLRPPTIAWCWPRLGAIPVGLVAALSQIIIPVLF